MTVFIQITGEGKFTGKRAVNWTVIERKKKKPMSGY